MSRPRPTAQYARRPPDVAIAERERAQAATRASKKALPHNSTSAVMRVMQMATGRMPTRQQLFKRLLNAPLGIQSPVEDKYIASAREEILRTCSMYIPDALQHRLGLSHLATIPPNVSGFMAWLLRSKESAPKMEFTMQTYHLAQIVQGLVGLGRSEQECALIRNAGEETINALFEEPNGKACAGTLYYALQPQGHQRCIATSLDRAGLPKDAVLGTLRNVPLQTVLLGSRKVPVIVYARAKRPLSTYLRFLRENTLNDAHIPDPFGFRFVFTTADDRRAFKQLLDERYPSIPATRSLHLDRYEGSSNRRPNPFRARHFRAEMWFSDFAGARWEFQLMEAPDFVNLWCSTGAENWYLYRLRQLVTLFFRHCFPEHLCGVNWKKEEKHCRQHVLHTSRFKIAP